ncbi:MAG: hypothetical protein QXD72_00930 [Candidatus Aenigmatarchaeota archaeon]
MEVPYKKAVKNFISQNLKDLIMIFTIPLVLFLLFLLPSNLKEMLVLHKDYSNVYDIFTTNFIHDEFNHLAFNVTTYTVVILLLYVLLLTLNKKELFYKLFIVNLTIIPILTSLIWIPVNKFIWTIPQRTLGFSGIVSSISGMVVYAYILLLHEKIKINTFYAYLSSIFFIPLLFTLIYFTFTTHILMTIIFLAIIFFITTYKTIRTIDKKAERNLIKISKRPKLVKLSLPILYLVVILFSLALFPKEFVQGNARINFFVHYTGFIIGTATFFAIDFNRAKKQLNEITKYLKEMHKNIYKKGDPYLSCLIRSQLLFLLLQKKGYKPKIMKYTVEGNENKNYEDKEKITNISGYKFPLHIVILLDGFILDANIGIPMPKEEYEKKVISYEPRNKLIFVEEESKIDTELCRQYAKECELSSFKELFTC